MGRIIRMWAGKVAGVALQVLRALPSLRVTVAGEARRIVFSEEGVVVAPIPCRPTPITTTVAAYFSVRLDAEGRMEMQILQRRPHHEEAGWFYRLRVGPRKLGQRRDRASTRWSDQTTSPVYSKWSSRDAEERTNALHSLRRNG